MQAKILLVVLIVAIAGGRAFGQPLPQVAPRTAGPSPAGEAAAVLPKTPAETDAAIAQLERRLKELRAQLTASKVDSTVAFNGLGATAEELAERDQLLQQWAIALDQRVRYLRSLPETRHLCQEQNREHESWRGFAEPPNIVVAEQLTDAASAQRLELRSAQMLLSIFEGDAARFSGRLKESLKQLRLVQDQAEQAAVRTPHHQWLIQLAQLRMQADEAAVETAQLGRLLTYEALEGQQRHLEFLESKLATARSLARISKIDVEGVLAQINEKRSTFQQDLKQAIAADEAARSSRDKVLNSLRLAQEENVASVAQTTNVAALQVAAGVERAHAETSRQKVEMLRGFLQLASYAETVWQDRVWAIESHSLSQLRAKQRHYEQMLEGLRQWKALMESSLSSISEQVLRNSLKADDPRLSPLERDAARQTFATLQERASVCLRAVGALVFTEDLTARLHAELTEQAAGLSFSDRVQSVLAGAGSVFRRIWNTELYIAEDSVIASGQKVSIPRAITLAKVVIALTIFLAGVLAARWIYGLGRRLAARWSADKQAADVSAKAVAAVVALVSLLVAMASVRIPWTVFAFMGGALAIAAGFGAQTLINNFISGVILLCERSIRVDDIVEVDDQRGKVIQVGFRSSLIERGDGIEVLIPNSQFLEKKVVNWTLSSDLVRQSVAVHVAYGAAPALVTRLIAQAAAEHPYVCQEPPADVLFEEFGDNGLVFTLKFWLRLCPTTDGGKVRSDLRHRINALFDQAGIVVAFPQRDIHLDSTRPLEIKLVGAGRAKEATLQP
jgi:small-conductance mechanosensitive channel